MTAKTFARAHRGRELQIERYELHKSAVTPSALLLMLLGLLCLGDLNNTVMPPIKAVWLAAIAMGVGLGALVLRERCHEVATALLVLGYTASLGLGLRWSGEPVLLALMALPIGVAAMGWGPGAGAGVAAALTAAVLWAVGPIAGAPALYRLLAAILGWATLGMVWVTLAPLMHTVKWAWEHFERARELLESARDRQQQLHEALDDLASAHTQLARLHQLTLALRQMAEEARREKQSFVANVSHELRTPLNMIIGFCELIGDNPEAYGDAIPPMLLGDLDVVLRNSRHLYSLIDDILDLSQIDAEAVALSTESTCLRGIVDEAVTAVRPLFQGKGLTLQVDMDPELPPVVCDRVRIREVMLNLLSNSGRFTEFGGVRVVGRLEGDDVVVSVHDSGQGIPEDKMRRLFQPFFQVERELNRRWSGTGLGLSISKGFVERHGGAMWAESVVGQGSTFYFRLPLVPPLPAAHDLARWYRGGESIDTRSRPVRYKLGPVEPRWIVVERGHTLQVLLSRHVQGVQVSGVATVDEAIEESRQGSAQAVLVNAPSIPAGWSALEVGRLPQGTPLILCSVPVPEERVESMHGGGYLVKPVSKEQLAAALDALGTPVESLLVVDDDPDALHLLTRMVTQNGNGCLVLRAYDGRQALDILQRRRVDAILLDLAMPNMSGFQFLEHRAASAELTEIPVIIVSAHDPLGQPIVSGGIAAANATGLSVAQLLRAIQALVGILAAVPGAPPLALPKAPHAQ